MSELSPFAVGVQCLAIVARMQQVAVSPSALLRELSPQSDDLSDIYLVKAAKSLDFRAKFIQSEPTSLDPVLLPAVVHIQYSLKALCHSSRV